MRRRGCFRIWIIPVSLALISAERVALLLPSHWSLGFTIAMTTTRRATVSKWSETGNHFGKASHEGVNIWIMRVSSWASWLLLKYEPVVAYVVIVVIRMLVMIGVSGRARGSLGLVRHSGIIVRLYLRRNRVSRIRNCIAQSNSQSQ